MQWKRAIVYEAAARFFNRLLEENSSDPDAKKALLLTEIAKQHAFAVPPSGQVLHFRDQRSDKVSKRVIVS